MALMGLFVSPRWQVRRKLDGYLALEAKNRFVSATAIYDRLAIIVFTS